MGRIMHFAPIRNSRFVRYRRPAGPNILDIGCGAATSGKIKLRGKARAPGRYRGVAGLTPDIRVRAPVKYFAKAAIRSYIPRRLYSLCVVDWHVPNTVKERGKL